MMHVFAIAWCLLLHNGYALLNSDFKNVVFMINTLMAIEQTCTALNTSIFRVKAVVYTNSIVDTVP